MLILKLALRNLYRNKRKTLLLGTLIAVGVAFLFFSNSVFESADKGVRDSFVNSLTGDVVLAAESETSFSLFGNEIPVVDDYEVIPSIPAYAEISSAFEYLENAESYTPVVAAAAAVETGKFRNTAAVFGIDPDSYFSVCPEIEIVRGNPADISSGGIFICEPLLQKAEAKLGHTLQPGTEIKLSLYSNGSFKIRKGTFAGCHRYVNKGTPFDAILLADPTVVRGLIDYTAGNVVEEETTESDTEEESFDFDDLFAEAEDTVSETEETFSLSDIETILADTSDRDAIAEASSTAWSFVLFKTSDAKALRSELDGMADENHWSVNIKGWRSGAGISAQMVFALQAAFNIGIIFIIIGAVLVIMNALVISVLERSYEIGTMRGIGAGKPFISLLFISESMILTLAASTIGIILGVIISLCFSGGIALENDLLITMFGGDRLQPAVTAKNIFMHFAGAAVVGALSWIYPVSIAVKIQPVAIMGRG